MHKLILHLAVLQPTLADSICTCYIVHHGKSYPVTLVGHFFQIAYLLYNNLPDNSGILALKVMRVMSCIIR